jgi:hypothetical protein
VGFLIFLFLTVSVEIPDLGLNRIFPTLESDLDNPLAIIRRKKAFNQPKFRHFAQMGHL